MADRNDDNGYRECWKVLRVIDGKWWSAMAHSYDGRVCRCISPMSWFLDSRPPSWPRSGRARRYELNRPTVFRQCPGAAFSDPISAGDFLGAYQGDLIVYARAVQVAAPKGIPVGGLPSGTIFVSELTPLEVVS